MTAVYAASKTEVCCRSQTSLFLIASVTVFGSNKIYLAIYYKFEVGGVCQSAGTLECNTQLFC